jgi:hypothetical protein
MKRTWCASVSAAVLLAGCPETQPPAPGGGGSGGSGERAWQTVYSGKDAGGALLSVWGTGPGDVYAVGGPLGNSGFTAVALHYDGTSWEHLEPGSVDSFWWVTGTGAHDVWMSGEHGRITHWDGQSFRDEPRLTSATIWGMWAASPSDAWAVGGTPEGGTAAPNDVVLHWNGAAWSHVTLPEELGYSLNKVWGASSDDLYVVGEGGTIWHKKGNAWAREASPATSRLLTVFGCSATDVWAVGGDDVLRSDGQTWRRVDVTLTNLVNGVTCGPGGEVLIVGSGGLKQRYVDGAWIDEFTSEPYGDLHGAWSDGHGAFWTAGGDFASGAQPNVARKAVLGRFGAGQVSAAGF